MNKANQKKEVKQIRLKDALGFGAYDESFDEKLIIEPNKISYSYKPLIETEENQLMKWSYQTTNPRYKAKFDELVSYLSAMLEPQTQDFFVLDLSPTELFVTYTDNSKEKRKGYFEGKEAGKFFAILSEMIPMNAYSKWLGVYGFNTFIT